MRNSKKLLCMLLSLIMVFSVFTVAAVSAGAYNSDGDYSKLSPDGYNPADSYTVDANTPYSEEAIVACGGDLSETQTMYFQAPADWANEFNTFEGPDDSEPYMHVCAYWWSGIAGAADKGWPSGKGCTWVGYQAHLVDKANRIYSIQMPNDGGSPTVVWNNGVNSGMDDSAAIFKFGRQILDANTEGAYEGDYDTLPEGSPTLDDFDGCIQIINYYVSTPNPLTGFDSYGSDWYVYYGDGCYGSYATDSDYFESIEYNCLNPEHYVNGVHVGKTTYESPTEPQNPSEPLVSDDGVIYFDAASAGWSGVSWISFYIYEIGGDNVTEWGSKNKRYTSNCGSDIFAFNAKEAGVQDGHEYGIIFENLDTCAQTADLLFNSTCFGDTAYVPNPDDKLENAVDSNKKSMKAAWKSSSLGTIKQITSIGNVVGESIPANTTAYQMMVNFLASKGSQSLMNALNWNGKDAQTTIDETAAALGLDQDDVEKAIKEAAETGANDGSGDKTDWTRKWDASRSYLPEGSGGVGGLVKDTDTIYVDLTAINELAGEGTYVYCNAEGFSYARVDANTLSVKIPNGVRTPVYNPASTATITISGRYEKRKSYDDGYSWWENYENYYFVTYPCLYDHSCNGDTLVIEKNKIDLNPATAPSEINYGGSDSVRHAVHWKNSDNNKYGMVKMFDSEGKVIGNCSPNFFGRIEQIKKYINNTLPKLSGMTWDSDQELIDAAAAEMGLKKADLALLLKNSSIEWKEEDCTLPDGYSYDEGAYYLKEKGSAKPIGYYEFLRDSSTGYYVVNVSGYRPSLYYYSSSSGGSSSTGGYEYTPVPEFDVVQYGSDGKFKTVNKESLSVVDGYLYFFDPDKGTFGYNTSGEIGNSSSSSSSSGWSDAPILNSVKTEGDGLKVTWEAPHSIRSDWGDFKYRVYIKGDKDWTEVADTSETSYLYTGAVSGNAYTFTVRCVSADGKKLLGSYDEYGISGRYLVAPEITKILSTSRGNELYWDPVPGNVRYHVKAKVKSTWKDLGDTYDTSFIHSSQDGALAAQKGVEYTYTVECVSYDGSAVTSDYNKTGWAITYTGEDSVGVKVSGKIRSYLSDTDPISVLLMQDGKVKKNVNVKGNSAEYSFDDVEAGTYTMLVTKKNHVNREYTMTVAGADVTKDVKLCPKGDVNGDGETDIMDCSVAQRYIRELTTLDDYQIACGDVSGTGDGELDIQDVSRILRHIRELAMLY